MSGRKKHTYIDTIHPDHFGKKYWSATLKTMVGVYPENISIIAGDGQNQYLKKKRVSSSKENATVTKRNV
jgi:hypothetical protein